MSKVRNAPGYRLTLRTRRLRIQWDPSSVAGWHSPKLPPGAAWPARTED